MAQPHHESLGAFFAKNKRSSAGVRDFNQIDLYLHEAEILQCAREDYVLGYAIILLMTIILADWLV